MKVYGIASYYEEHCHGGSTPMLSILCDYYGQLPPLFKTKKAAEGWLKKQKTPWKRVIELEVIEK